MINIGIRAYEIRESKQEKARQASTIVETYPVTVTNNFAKISLDRPWTYLGKFYIPSAKDEKTCWDYKRVHFQKSITSQGVTVACWSISDPSRALKDNLCLPKSDTNSAWNVILQTSSLPTHNEDRIISLQQFPYYLRISIRWILSVKKEDDDSAEQIDPLAEIRFFIGE